jgi:hypothetical protein
MPVPVCAGAADARTTDAPVTSGAGEEYDRVVGDVEGASETVELVRWLDCDVLSCLTLLPLLLDEDDLPVSLAPEPGLVVVPDGLVAPPEPVWVDPPGAGLVPDPDPVEPEPVDPVPVPSVEPLVVPLVEPALVLPPDFSGLLLFASAGVAETTARTSTARSVAANRRNTEDFPSWTY